MRRVIVSVILAPYRAKESAVAARRSLVISPASSHQAHIAVLVFARARACGHFSLVCSSNAYRENHKLLSSGFPVTEKSAGYLLVRRLFPFFGIFLLMGQCNLVYDDLRPCGDPDSLQSKRSLGGLISDPCKFSVSVPRCFVT